MYQIVLTENRKKIKVLNTYSRLRDAHYRFNKIGSVPVFLPKQSVYKNKKLLDIKYEILLLKSNENGDANMVTKDKFGRNIEVKVDDDQWVVLDKMDYEVEEQFNVTGADRKLNAKEIIDHVVINNLEETNPKQILVLNNKVVIEGLDLFMVTCKNTTEAFRLYNKIRLHCFDNKIGHIIFFGNIPKENKKVWYKKIHDRTGVKYNRLYRSNSR